MFSFYGSKSKIVHLYPPPKYDQIVEPFAGSARYSLRYADHDVLLVEIDPTIYGIWRWLIKECTLTDVENLPDLKIGDDLRRMKQLSQVEQDLLGFAVGYGVSFPRNVVTQRADRKSHDPSDRRWRPNNACDLLKKNLRENLSRVKHWRVVNSSWESLRINPEATWFVDPPYFGSAGRGYVYSGVDYKKLSGWVLSRRGQVIVCEGAEATWLPFERLCDHQGCRGIRTEVVFLKG